MLWVVHCLDESGATQRRIAARPAHSARLRAGHLKPVLYGPLVAPDGETVIGSLIIVEADTQEEVTQFYADDPFATQGVWREIRVYGLVLSQNSPVRWPIVHAARRKSLRRN
ncbi:MAG: YciI family protein [Pseudonocardiaceae bacterium]